MIGIEDFFDLVENNEVNKIDKIIKSGFDINQKNKFGGSAIHTAVFKDLRDMVKLLIDSGININIQNKDGKTSLHYVAEYDSVSLAKVLLENGADLSIQDKYGNQPLWTAVFNDKGRNDRRDLIKLFLKYGADVNHKNNVDKSPKDIVAIANYKNLEDIIF